MSGAAATFSHPLFEAVPGSRSAKIRCKKCGRTGYSNGAWADQCERDDHEQCPFCKRWFCRLNGHLAKQRLCSIASDRRALEAVSS